MVTDQRLQGLDVNHAKSESIELSPESGLVVEYLLPELSSHLAVFYADVAGPQEIPESGEGVLEHHIALQSRSQTLAQLLLGHHLHIAQFYAVVIPELQGLAQPFFLNSFHQLAILISDLNQSQIVFLITRFA